MRSLSFALAACLLVGAALAGPAAAAKPARGCGSDKFTLMNYQTFRALSVSVGVPASLLGPDHLAHWNENIDKNDDGLACIMDLPDTPGTFEGWIFNAVDNTAKR